MIGYRDRSWCSSSSICARTQCSRHFGERERAGYEAWKETFEDKSLAGVAYSDFRSDTCGFLWKKGK